MLAILAGVGVSAFFLGRRQHVQADTPKGNVFQGADAKNYDPNVVAYMYDNLPVTRAELGEYLIARFGGERLEFLVNRKIVEIECYKRSIVVTEAEVEDRFQRDLKAFGTHITEHDFVNSILRRFGKTLYEWKEDVIRPKLMMEKLVRPLVQITDQDLHEGFEARYGPKVKCRMIVIDAKAGAKVATDVYQEACKGPKEFDEAASKQFIPNLAAAKGEVPPIHKHFGDKYVEDKAFSMKEGEICLPLKMQDNTFVIMYCEKHLPADTKVRFEDERMKLSKEIFEMKLAQKIPEEFAKLQKAANPRPMLTRTEPRGTLPSIQQPVYPASAPAVRTDVAPLVPGPVTAPTGYTPLSPSAPSPPPIVLPPQTGLLPPTSNVAPTDKK
jgi:hypothetical protein